ncbi:hypothetical protein AMTR_s01597p00009530, partial [Amborella trichopoda]
MRKKEGELASYSHVRSLPSRPAPHRAAPPLSSVDIILKKPKKIFAKDGLIRARCLCLGVVIPSRHRPPPCVRMKHK